MVGWISIFIYNSSFLDTLLKHGHHHLELSLPVFNSSAAKSPEDSGPLMSALGDITNLTKLVDDHLIQGQNAEEDPKSKQTITSSLKKLMPVQRPMVDVWSRLPATHWPMLFSLYNVTLQGRHVTLLPPIHLSIVIGTESAKMLRHPKETAAEASKGHEGYENEHEEHEVIVDEDALEGPELSPFVPTSPSELFLGTGVI